MARKKKPGASHSLDQTRVELRIESETAEQLKAVCDKTGISVNQLMQTLARWAVSNAHPGSEPVYDQEGELVNFRAQEGCIWFGDNGARWTPDGEVLDPPSIENTEIHFWADFTDRNALRPARPRSK